MADQPEDHDRQGRPVVADQERRGAELAQRARRTRSRPRRAAASRRPAGRRRAAPAAGEAPRVAAACRSRSSIAGRAPAPGSARRAAARPAPGRPGSAAASRAGRAAGWPRVIRKPKPSVTAETPSGSMKTPSSTAAQPALGPGARAAGHDDGDGEPEQQRHPGRVDGDPQRVHQRVGDRHQQRLVGAGGLQGAVVGQAPARRRRAATRTTSETSGRATRSDEHQRSRRSAGRSPTARAPQPDLRRGPPWRPAYGGRGRPRASRRGDHQQLQHRERGRGLEVEEVGGEQVDLGLDAGVAQPAEGQHDPERGGAEEEDDASPPTRSPGAAPGRVTSRSTCHGDAPSAAAASAGRGSSDSQAPPTDADHDRRR